MCHLEENKSSYCPCPTGPRHTQGSKLPSHCFLGHVFTSDSKCVFSGAPTYAPQETPSLTCGEEVLTCLF